MIIEDSVTRLQLRVDRNGFRTGLCVLERERDEAEITRFALGVPVQHRRLQLSTISDVMVRRRPSSRDYHPVLVLGSGRTISIGICSKNDAIATMKAIRRFLKTPAESPSA